MSDAKPQATKALTPIEALRKAATIMEPQFKIALPAHIPVEKFMRVFQTAANNNPKLIDANRTKLFGAVMKAAQDGLLPDGKEAALIPFGNDVGYIPMIAGILKKIRNSGELASIGAHTVHQNDSFAYWIDENGEHLNHRPELAGDRGQITHAYAMARTKDGGIYIEVMSKGEIEQVRQVSRSRDAGPWKEWYGEMAKKTVLRRLSKRLPSSTDLDFSNDDDVIEGVVNPPPTDVPVETEAPIKAPKTRSSRLEKAMNLKDKPEVVDVQSETTQAETETPDNPQVSEDTLPI